MSRKHYLLDAVRIELKLHSDAELAKRLAYCRPMISRIRNRKLNITNELKLSIHEETGWSFAEIERLTRVAEEQNI